ncbi:sugar O-acetyltransferase [Flavobacterium sp. LC2016-01]|uniref:sugar O-acetyltransferase n=1 Tax=Flavobacterium sp. LC2016-01 TaxID=2675876 RepID=UPI0012BAA4C5|nr:sugar O-acetyltransferase [Flavobacterium sp. LC2016-01]MTH15738.1 sugar O-acetyltransferase [Flavobacterium sp. LC2016-01]
MKTEKEKMISGEYYNAFDPELLKGRRAAKNLLHSLNVKEYRVTKKAKEILATLIPNAGAGLYIEPPFHCDYGYNIFCGDNVYFNVNCVVLDCAPVNIGSNVFIAPNVQIYTASHPLDAELRKTLENAYPVTIGDDCWIGGNSVICPGVTIGKGCVIGAGSVVTKDIPDNSLAVGNPAKVIRKLNQEPESKK